MDSTDSRLELPKGLSIGADHNYHQKEEPTLKRTNQVIACILLIVMLLTTLPACATDSQNSLNGNSKEPRVVVDIVGDEVIIPAEVNTVVCLVPFGCQIMIGLGLGDYLVGINDETIETPWIEVMYPRIKEIPTYGYEPDVEAVLAANPDVVLCADQETAQEFRDKGVPAVTIMYYSVDDFKNTVTLIGTILGGEALERCNAYLEYFDAVVDDVDAHLRDKVTKRETLYYINGTSDRGFYKTAGAGSTNDAVAQLSYADFATNPILQSPETKVDAEAILSQNPENIIIGGRWQHVLYEELMASPEWSSISAVKNGNVFKVPMGMAAWNRYSIEIALMIPWTASVMYPEYYEFDAVQETIDFYKRFSGYELSVEQATFIVKGLTPDGEKEIASR